MKAKATVEVDSISPKCDLKQQDHQGGVDNVNLKHEPKQQDRHGGRGQNQPKTQAEATVSQ
jgi:hypothetical protein